MTAAELRDLLAEVEKRGGPVTVYDDSDHSTHMRVGFHFDRHPDYFIIETMRPSEEAVLVGVLKRDLIERGRYFVTEYAPVEYPIKPNPKPPWYAEIRPDGTLNHRAVAMERGRSELDALLRAWLAAAKAEGWGA